MPIVVLDPGHGGTDSGATGNGLLEKNLNLAIALKTAQYLRQLGVDVRLTRTTDVFVPLSQRATFANNIGADYFLSIHINAGGGTGFESYCYNGTEDNFTLNAGHIIHQRVASYYTGFGLPDRGEKRADFAVLRETKMAASLLECGFIDNGKDASLLKNNGFLNGMALNAASAVATVFHLPQHTQPPPEKVSKYFVDVVKGMEWASPHIDSLFEKGIMVGDGMGNFSPENQVNRMALAVVVDKAIAYILNHLK